MSKGKQPYIPLYIGDWEQDTNCLSIEAEGAWLKVVFKCWKSNGIFTASEEVFARLCKVSVEKFASILLEWQQNRICEIVSAPGGQIQITSRRIKREKEISEVRSEIGSKGGSKTQANSKAKNEAKVKQTPEYENENESPDLNKKETENQNVASVVNPWDIEEVSDVQFDSILDDLTRDRLIMTFRGVDIDGEWTTFKEKVRGSPEKYQNHDASGLKLAFNYQLRDAKSKINGSGRQTKKQQQQSELIEGYTKKYGNGRSPDTGRDKPF